MNISIQAEISNNCRPIPKVNHIKPIGVPVYDLPEYLCVETKFVSQQNAMDNHINVIRTTERMVNGVHTDVSQKPQERASAAVSKISQDGDLPKRERWIQTEAKETSDVGVQCCRDADDWDWDDSKNVDGVKDTKDSNSDESAFLTYVSEKTSMFPNGMLECQVCGEVSSSLAEHQGHMKVHYGPKVLCYHCGQRIAHERLVKRHNLTCSGLAPRKPTIFFKCPHPLCSVQRHSEVQLFKHLGKHNGRRSYKCLQCNHIFKTTSTLLIHRKAVSGCSKAKCLALFNKHKLPKEKRDLRCCSVCLKRFSSERICNKHRRKCILGYHNRLSKTLLNEL